VQKVTVTNVYLMRLNRVVKRLLIAFPLTQAA
jgi:hypothetical protein